MSGSVNKVILIGHLGRDPEMRRMASGDPVANFSIATSDTWRDKESGEKKERTTWHNVVIFNEGLAKVAEAYLKKGSKVYVEGAIQTRKYTDKEGVEQTVTEVVLQRYRGELVLLGDAGAGRPAPSEDDYGTTRTKEPAAGRTSDDPHTQQRAGYPEGVNGYPQTPRGGSAGALDDSIPF